MTEQMALSAFIKNDATSLLAFAFNLTRNRDEAEDLAQETYRKIATRWPDETRSRPLLPWCLTVLKNLHRDRLRGYHAKHTSSLDAPAFEEGASLELTIPDADEGVEKLLERREAVELVRLTLRRMKATHRRALTICDMDGMSYEEAARAIGIPLSTFRTRLYRARQAFRMLHPETIHV